MNGTVDVERVRFWDVDVDAESDLYVCPRCDAHLHRDSVEGRCPVCEVDLDDPEGCPEGAKGPDRHGWRPIQFAPASEPGEERIMLLVWAEGAGERGEGDVFRGYVYIGPDGERVGVAEGCGGYAVTHYQPRPGAPERRIPR